MFIELIVSQEDANV